MIVSVLKSINNKVLSADKLSLCHYIDSNKTYYLKLCSQNCQRMQYICIKSSIEYYSL
jgi:hypothetical protein